MVVDGSEQFDGLRWKIQVAGFDCSNDTRILRDWYFNLLRSYAHAVNACGVLVGLLVCTANVTD